MDPIIIVGPDGAEVEFPAGTDDATIEAAMAEAYPSVSGAGDPGAAAPEEQPLNDENEDLDYRHTWAGTNEAQQAYYAQGLEDGSVNPNFPAGTDQHPYVIPENMSDEDMQDLIERGVTYVDREGRLQRKADDLYGLYVGASRPVINTMNWAENAVEGAANLVGLDGEAASEGMRGWREDMGIPTEESNAELEALARQAGVRPGRGGQVAGAVAATAPLALATRNPWLLGAAEGALGSNAQDAAGLARDTALGAVVGKGGDVATGALGTMVRPNINPTTRRLVEEGVEVSPGQLLGGVAHRAEDAMTGVPALGDIPNAAQRRAQESVATVALQRPLTALGLEMPRNLNSVHQQVDFTQRAVSDAYDELIPQLDVRLDQQFAQEFNSLRQNAQAITGDAAGMFESLIQREVMPRFNAAIGPANGRITGESFKELESLLGKEVRDFSGPTASGHARRYASAVRELQAQLRDMLARGNPQHADRLTSINDAYRQLTVLEDAVNRAPAGARGAFTPDQLNTAARMADPSIRRRAAARGDTLFMDLSQDAGEVMKRTVNDSGTATRGAMTAALGAAFFGQSMNIAINPWAVGALALGALPYNRTGNRLFTAALTQRPAAAGPIREVLDNNSWLGAMGAAGHNTVDRNENRREAEEYDAIAADRDRWDALQQQMDAGYAPQ